MSPIFAFDDEECHKKDLTAIQAPVSQHCDSPKATKMKHGVKPPVPPETNTRSGQQAQKPNPDEQIKPHFAKKKKKKAMKPGAPAAKVTRGFETPTPSAGEESDFSCISSPRITPLASTAMSVVNSPSIRPSNLTRVISGLKLQDTVKTVDERLLNSTAYSSRSTGSNVSVIQNDSDSDADVSGSEINDTNTHDFALSKTLPKPLLSAVEGGLRRDSPHRKMNAMDFEPIKCLGKGAFGTVLLVKQLSTGRLFAQKQLKKATITVHDRLIQQTKSERKILESVKRHPFVVKLFYAFQDHSKLYLILEYAQGGELFHHLAMERMFSEEVSAFYMAEMVLALDYLHTNLGVVYRDLKPENCLLDAEGHLLLTDFGLSKVTVDDDMDAEAQRQCNSILGTIDYMAPEVVEGKPYAAAVDWWSLGALGYDLLTGAPPFASNNHKKTQQKILQVKLSWPYYLSPDAKDLLTRLLRKDPRKRLGGNMPKDLAIIKAHRFFRKINWKLLARRECAAPIQPIITDPAAAENFSTDFTDLAMSPVESKTLEKPIGSQSNANDPFGGFSFVASHSLLESGIFDN